MSGTTQPADESQLSSAAPRESAAIEFTDDRRFQLYLQQRKGFGAGARDAYQRFDQTIAALSGGSIVVSITFFKDIGHSPESLPWLFGSWICFLVASLCAFISILTSGEAHLNEIQQLDCLVLSGTCDESKAESLRKTTRRLNYFALTFCIVGVVLIIVFATQNLLHMGGDPWTDAKRTTPPSSKSTAPAAVAPRQAAPPTPTNP
jgi:hypothetical protein